VSKEARWNEFLKWSVCTSSGCTEQGEFVPKARPLMYVRQESEAHYVYVNESKVKNWMPKQAVQSKESEVNSSMNESSNKDNQK